MLLALLRRISIVVTGVFAFLLVALFFATFMYPIDVFTELAKDIIIGIFDIVLVIVCFLFAPGLLFKIGGAIVVGIGGLIFIIL